MNEHPIYDKNFAPMPIATLLDGKHHFAIPSFQRGYRWEEKQVLDLLKDIRCNIRDLKILLIMNQRQSLKLQDIKPCQQMN